MTEFSTHGCDALHRPTSSNAPIIEAIDRSDGAKSRARLTQNVSSASSTSFRSSHRTLLLRSDTLPHMSNAVVSVPDTANDPPSPNASVAKIAAEGGAKVTTLRLVKSTGSPSADDDGDDTSGDDEGHPNANAIDDIEAQRQQTSKAPPTQLPSSVDVRPDDEVTIQVEVDADPLPSSTFARVSRPTSLESSSGGRRPSLPLPNPTPAKLNESSRMRDVERGEAGIKALVASGW